MGNGERRTTPSHHHPIQPKLALQDSHLIHFPKKMNRNTGIQVIQEKNVAKAAFNVASLLAAFALPSSSEFFH